MEQQDQGEQPRQRRRRPRRRRRGGRSRRSEESAPTTPMAVAARKLGIAQLRPEQEQVIADVLAGRDVLMILPTGFGKSACYQIPALIFEKPVVMVSPLRALLSDQEKKFIERDLPVVRIDGNVRGRNRVKAFERIAAGGPLLVMTTPETLAKADTTEALKNSGVSLIAVDEAHCLSEWGHDFRPAYLRLGSRIQALGSPPILALTATATPRVRTGILRMLRMRDPQVIASSPHRSNLAFEVLPCEGSVRARVMLRLVRKLRRPGIVYCSTRREVDFVYALLRRFKIPTHRYHGGMLTSERNAEQEHFMTGKSKTVMVATNAFGLGIDKPDIRYILHYQMPASLEQYVQEAGRGGRDGSKANCILLPDPADRQIHEALLSRSRIRPEQLYRMGEALAAWSDEEKRPSLEGLALSADMGPRVAAALVAKIEESGLIFFDDKEIQFTDPDSDIEEESRKLAGQFETLRTQDGRRLDALARYSSSTECRAAFLCDYFGEEVGAPCGLCDICRGSPTRPESFFEPITPPSRPKKKKRNPRRGKKKRPSVAAAATAEGETKTSKPRRRRRRRKPKAAPS